MLNEGIRPVYQMIERGEGDGWKTRERFWISHYRTICQLTNLTDGGEGTPGLVVSEKTRKALSLSLKGIPYAPGRVSAMKGKNHTPEAIEKIRKAGIGRRHSEASKSKMKENRKGKKPAASTIAASIAARIGKKLTEEHKRKIAATTKNRKAVLTIETGRIFDSVTAASRALMVSEASIYQAIRKGCRCKGNHLRFL